MRDKFSLKENIANIVTHGIGFLFSIVASVVLIVSVSARGDTRQIISSVVYAVSLIVLYASSTLYHSLPSERLKHIPNMLDHSAIYLFIAGTYTPFTLVTIRGIWGWSYFIVIWALALAGIIFVIFSTKGIGYPARTRYLITSYLIMGWLALTAAQPVIRNIPLEGVLLLIGGGAFYSLGIIFLSWDRLPFHHAIWHLFVLGGCVCHYFAIFFYALSA